MQSIVATAKAATWEATRKFVRTISKVRGMDCLSRDATISLCMERGLEYVPGKPTTFTGKESDSLEIFSRGVARIDGKSCLYADFGNRSALAEFSKPRHRVAHAIALWSHKWLGYYHFLAEVCPKICILQQELGMDFGGAKLCYPMIHRRYETELLEMLSVSPESVIDSRAVGGVVAEKLTIVPMDGWFGIPPNIPILRERLMPPPVSKGEEMLYLRRTGRRQFLQEDQIVPELEKRGFVMVEESSRSITEQIHLFRDARVIAGAHGAAFTNMIWASPRTQVVEMVPSTFDVPYYNRLSQACGHGYKKIPCPNGPTAQSGDGIDFNADPAIVLREIDRVIANTGETPEKSG